MGNLMPPLDPAHALFGVSVVFGAPLNVTTTAILAPGDVPPAPGDLLMGAPAAVSLRRTIALKRADLPTLPVGSTLVADFGDGSRTYRIDRVDPDFATDEWRAVIS